MNPAPHLLLFTASFPWDGAAEQTFLAPELPRLAERFASVTLVPELTSGVRLDLPAGVACDRTLADAYAAAGTGRLAMKGFLHPGSLVRATGAAGFWPLRLRKLGRLLRQFGRARLAEHWMQTRLARSSASAAATIAYTYWLSPVTLGLGWAKGHRQDFLLVSRAHGHDVYAERHRYAYLPSQPEAVAALDRLFPTSHTAAAYLAARYPAATARIEPRYLGIEDPGLPPPVTLTSPIRLASCSALVPVKRVPLLLQGVAELGRRNPAVRYAWRHLGAGPGLAALAEQAEKSLPANVAWEFPGQLPNREVLAGYHAHPPALFFNTSESEGLPVSVMEAQGCGIPVVATAVGGNVEAVSTQNGALLPPNPSPAAIAAAAESLLADPAAWAEKARASRASWQDKFDAQTNHAAFACRLLELVAGRQEP